MDPRKVIETHLDLCKEVHDLLLEENTWLKNEKKAPDSDLLDRKQIILPQLETSLQNLRKLKPEFFSPFDDSKKLVNDSHAKLLQIFYVDRENEDLLLKLTQSTERQTFNRFTASPEQINEIHNRMPSQDSDSGDTEAVEDTE
tara:strand:+ start:564 stop:992 length:429 start_codon:yes stop_codon:yes gene_type:complete